MRRSAKTIIKSDQVVIICHRIEPLDEQTIKDLISNNVVYILKLSDYDDSNNINIIWVIYYNTSEKLIKLFNVDLDDYQTSNYIFGDSRNYGPPLPLNHLSLVGQIKSLIPILSSQYFDIREHILPGEAMTIIHDFIEKGYEKIEIS